MTGALIGFAPYLAQSTATAEFPLNVTVSPMIWVQLVLVPDPPEKSIAPVGT
jgi:hypothetical protein